MSWRSKVSTVAPRVTGGKKPDERDQEQTGVQGFPAVAQRANFSLESSSTNLLVNLATYGAPALQRGFEVKLLGAANGAVERHPGHDFGVREVAAPAAHFPDAFVGPLPNRLQMRNERAL